MGANFLDWCALFTRLPYAKRWLRHQHVDERTLDRIHTGKLKVCQ